MSLRVPKLALVALLNAWLTAACVYAVPGVVGADGGVDATAHDAKAEADGPRISTTDGSGETSLVDGSFDAAPAPSFILSASPDVVDIPPFSGASATFVVSFVPDPGFTAGVSVSVSVSSASSSLGGGLVVTPPTASLDGDASSATFTVTFNVPDGGASDASADSGPDVVADASEGGADTGLPDGGLFPDDPVITIIGQGNAQRTASVRAHVMSTTLVAHTSQSWTVPPGITSVFVKAWGAGGSAGYGSGSHGGAGGFVSAQLQVDPTSTLQIDVGTTGKTASYSGGGGGGYSGVLSGASPLAIAGGGGGSGEGPYGGAGGEGGGISATGGGTGYGGAAGGGGATETGPGQSATGAPSAPDGGMFAGASWGAGGGTPGGGGGSALTSVQPPGAGGGGGYYGGGAGQMGGGGGGGGSGYAIGSGALETGSGTKPGGATDPDYDGKAGTPGAAGLVLLWY